MVTVGFWIETNCRFNRVISFYLLDGSHFGMTVVLLSGRLDTVLRKGS